jgi:hypothetical protein
MCKSVSFGSFSADCALSALSHSDFAMCPTVQFVMGLTGHLLCVISVQSLLCRINQYHLCLLTIKFVICLTVHFLISLHYRAFFYVCDTLRIRRLSESTTWPWSDIGAFLNSHQHSENTVEDKTVGVGGGCGSNLTRLRYNPPLTPSTQS